MEIKEVFVRMSGMKNLWGTYYRRVCIFNIDFCSVYDSARHINIGLYVNLRSLPVETVTMI